MIFFAIGLYLQSKNKLIKILILIVLLLDFITLFASQTIGGLMGLIGGLSTLILMGENKIRNSTILTGILIMLGLGAFFLYPQIFVKISFFTERILDRLRVNYVGITLIREDFWFGTGELVFETIKAHPHLMRTPLGAGWNVPHNFLISTFVRGGVFYFGAFLYLLYVGSKKLRSALPTIYESQNNKFYKSLLAGLIAFIIQCMSNNIFWHVRLGIYLFLFFALIIKLDEEGDLVFPNWF